MGCCDFSDTVMEHFMCPRNVGCMAGADGEGTCGEPGCGDYITIYIRVNDNRISDASFLVSGCVAAIATSSMTTELVKGRTLEEAYRLTEQNIVDALGGLPEHKLHCSVLGAQAIKRAVEDYWSRVDQSNPSDRGVNHGK